MDTSSFGECAEYVISAHEERDDPICSWICKDITLIK